MKVFKDANNAIQDQLSKSIERNNNQIKRLSSQNDVYEDAKESFAMFLDKAWDVIDSFAIDPTKESFETYPNSITVTIGYGSYTLGLLFNLNAKTSDLEVVVYVLDSYNSGIYREFWNLGNESGPDFETFLLDGLDFLADKLNEAM